MFNQIVTCLFGGMGVGFQAFLSVLPLYKQLCDFKWQFIACALGIPVAFVLIIRFVPKVFKLLKR